MHEIHTEIDRVLITTNSPLTGIGNWHRLVCHAPTGWPPSDSETATPAPSLTGGRSEATNWHP